MSVTGWPRDWDAATYDRVADPVVALGLEVLERLPLEGDETVLDAGCGSGRITAALAARLPRGRVLACDASPSMVEMARAVLGPPAEVFVADLCELRLEQPVDAIFSAAVFHWIANHDRLFRRLHAALRPGGRLVAQCGGAGNVETLRASVRELSERDPFRSYLGQWAGPWRFATPEDAKASLERAGFEEVDCRLEPRAVTPAEPLEYLCSVCLGHHLERLPQELRPAFVEAVGARLGEPLTLNYVRLNIDARRAPNGA